MWTFWFLACLFVLNIFFYFAKKILKTDIKMGILALFTICAGWLYYKEGGIALPWNIDACLMAYPFYFAGHFCKEKNEYIDKYLTNNKITASLFIIMLFINIICGYFAYKISGSTLDMCASSYGLVPLTFVSAFAGIVCVIIVSRCATIKPIQYIGQNSLLYLAWHQVIMIPVSVILLGLFRFTIDGTSSTLMYIIFRMVQAIIILTSLTVCNYVINNTKLRFMLGKI